MQQGLEVYGYFNNHYQGHSPASVRAFQLRLAELDSGVAEPPTEPPTPPPGAPTLFDLD